ncbi:PREDICTED: uncharacterized protein LOC104602274 isoform X1 [Nelumbo nucifera]|uniref:Uncharacterized protein LOC104602274 isoform X1 n=2 Tax=Nelumbo nucifera TaxID=4432 RepID=A0A1U8A9U1_NELNU|nr:PREDICTED: uncharacterized protein LOC104602274 isoform X1 [Nelumbo nucifera]DAD35378.1 TPA_asm: hypothetical protein HUJ06_006018 [Nelumbo nucifera]
MASLLSIHTLAPLTPKAFLRIKSVNNQRVGKPVSVLSRASAMGVQYQLKEGQSRVFHVLPSGLNMEVIIQKSTRNDPNEDKSENPPLVFVHGSFHAAWCWAEHWLSFFSQHGYDCYAVSLLAQGESDSPAGKVAGSLQTHANDIADFIQKEVRLSPVLIGHSFGGLIVQSYLSDMRTEHSSGRDNLLPRLAGAVLICSVPPSGNGGLVWRYLLSKPIAAFKVTLSLAAKAFSTSLPLCKETFFSPEMEDHLVRRYQELMKESSRLPLFDLRKLNASLPVPSIPRSTLQVLVLGASDDFIVDDEGLNETARFYGVPPVCVKGVAHDMMLDCSWGKGADMILSWLNSLNKQNSM